MSRVWMWMLVLACVLVPGLSHGQAGGSSGMLGLPLVVKEQGWARYTLERRDGEFTELVFRLGQPDTHQGKKGRWVIFEVDVPEMGRLTMHFLVAGERFTLNNVLRMRVGLPGKPLQDARTKGSPPAQGVNELQVLRKVRETVAGRTLEVTEFKSSEGIVAGWSPSVPVLGLTRVTGAQPLKLVAFGVGGDPWKGRLTAPIWPEEKEPKR